MNTSPPPVLYRVTDSKGDLVMLAPLHTLTLVFELDSAEVQNILKRTFSLGKTCRLVVLGWVELQVERLPIGIPAGERAAVGESDFSIPRMTARAAFLKREKAKEAGGGARLCPVAKYGCVLEAGHAGEHSFGERTDEKV